MTILEPIRLSCPVCAERFESKRVVSTNGLGGKRTDFHERANGPQPLAYLMHMCVRCGYSGSVDEFTSTEVNPMLRQQVWSELAPLLTESHAPASAKYEAAAKIATWQQAERRAVADLLLRAAWCCVDEGDTEAERYFRRKAAWAFEESLSTFDGVARDERAVLTYLIGELWRRIGDRRQATAWFDRVAWEIIDHRDQAWILEIARQQRDCPREWFG
jgi:uncharacterized protein (DUF2225 family)